jgi:cellulose synthase (UDP-forming)
MRPARVRDERVFSRRQTVVYAALTVVNVGVMTWLLAYWFRPGQWSPQTPSYVVTTVLLLFPLVLFELRWIALPTMRRPVHMDPSPAWKVGVATTFVPDGEDIAMLERTVRGLVAMDYPHDTWVLDEGDDSDVRALCARLGALHFTRKGVERYQQRSGRFGANTKHGNYNAWLDAVGYERYDIVTAFDPDHVPTRRFLTRVLGYFDDPSVGYVQAPQFYYNQRASFVARGAAEETYAYYSSLQMSSYAIGYPILTGCHNTHRVAALSQVGGFADHEADDLLITIRYRIAAWKGVYVPERLAAGLTPVDMFSYLNQQRRWARSVLDIKLRVVPKLSGRLPPRVRAACFLHGLSYLQGLSTALGFALLSFMLIADKAPPVVSLATFEHLLAAFVVLQLCDAVRQWFFLEPRRERGLHWRAAVLRAAKWPYVLLGLWDVLTHADRGYTLTRKLRRSGGQRYLALRAHLGIAMALGLAWAVGSARGVGDPRALNGAAAAALAMSLLVTLTELPALPPSYDDKLAAVEFDER